MKSVQKTLRKIREMEGELAYAGPARAAQLTAKIVRLKATLFD